ncbi:hypothetical protein DFH09DRAFT_1283521 [Mycena vulgaris]|nr:hypothetical protein DFH09DRAFT_1283521 [Mycena vulgaris]
MSKQSSQPLLQGGPTGAGLPQYTHRPVAYQVYPVSYQAVSYQPIALPLRTEYRRSPLRRFIVSFLVAVGIFALLKAVVRHHRHAIHWGQRWNIPANMVLDRCDGGSAWAVSDAAVLAVDGGPAAESFFDISLRPDTVLVLARYTKASYFFGGTPLSGSLDITTSPRLNHTARIVVSSVHDNSNIKTCLMRGEDGQTGVGIFAGRGFSGAKNSLKIRLILPQGTTPLQIKGLVADLPQFSVNVADLKDAVEFESVKLRTSNAAMHVKSLSARDAELRTSNSAIRADSLIGSSLILATSNGGISGTFNTSDSLTLSTSNGAIRVAVGLSSLSGTRETTLHMRTSNDRLDAKISLSAEGQGGRFGVVGTTSNGALGITVADADALGALALDLAARTSNARAEVALPRAYEGTFALATSGYSASVRRGDEGEDTRRIEYAHGRSGGRRVRGYIYEDENGGKERGRVGVTTSNAPVVLVV